MGIVIRKKKYSFTDNETSQSGKYLYRLKQIDIDGKYEHSKIVEVKLSSPVKFELSQNYPNPFNPSTTIKYSIPSLSVMLNSFQHLNNSEIPKQVRDDDVNVTLKVYDIIGREAETLFNQKRKAGTYEVIWYASRQPSGVYFYKLTACNYVETKKMIFLK